LRPAVRQAIDTGAGTTSTRVTDGNLHGNSDNPRSMPEGTPRPSRRGRLQVRRGHLAAAFSHLARSGTRIRFFAFNDHARIPPLRHRRPISGPRFAIPDA
jgi:hypothetical protein